MYRPAGLPRAASGLPAEAGQRAARGASKLISCPANRDPGKTPPLSGPRPKLGAGRQSAAAPQPESDKVDARFCKPSASRHRAPSRCPAPDGGTLTHSLSLARSLAPSLSLSLSPSPSVSLISLARSLAHSISSLPSLSFTLSLSLSLTLFLSLALALTLSLSPALSLPTPLCSAPSHTFHTPFASPRHTPFASPRHRAHWGPATGGR